MRPESFDEDLRYEWDEWALEHGLPENSQEPVLGESLPIARWAGPHFGAVLHVAWQGGVADEPDTLCSEVQVYRRNGASWRASSGGGGTGWFDPPLVRPSDVGPRDVVVVHVHESGDGAWRCGSADGIAGVEAAWLELHDAAGVTSRPVESPFGAFIVAWDATEAALLRVLDNDRGCIFERAFSP